MNPVASPVRRPKRWESRPTIKAAKADPTVQVYKRMLLIVAISQIFAGAGLVAGVTVGALLAQDMLGTDSLTGIPAALSKINKHD
ncbi:hypothetical protein GK047_28685 [Paenibacillus sp. SYP-B3998]|uniref:MFS transporter n=1 Tax=Paenibacillus sp. SYP-B3998 TaxID=2678564 RepID=A0A6G4A6D1_9BACL|nr:hypothetical protein [Paenibacillus sp. SYP-B3998]